MFRPVRVSTEFAFLLCGVFIIVVAWALNLLGTLSSEQASAHGGDVYLWFILMLQGLIFSTVGLIGTNYREFTANPMLGKRFLVAFLLIADGGLHLLALNQHLANLPAALFFEIVSPVQILGGLAFPYLARRFDPIWLLFTGFLIAAFILTRTVAIWPIGVVEDLDPLGFISKGVELLTIGVLVSLIRTKDTMELDRPTHSPTNDS